MKRLRKIYLEISNVCNLHVLPRHPAGEAVHDGG